MIILAGCRVVETLREDNKTGIYRALRDDENGLAQKVIIKTLRAAYPPLEDVAQLHHEFEIARSLPLAGVVQPLSLVNHNNSVALLLEDFGGISLHDYLADYRKARSPRIGLELDLFFPIAISLCATLEQVHARRVIHKDIKPDNVLIHIETGEIKLSDFGIASQLPSENQDVITTQRMQGTLAYMSPEQTGRMNQAVDYRTDFYSLGVTFYEMLTGRLPFEVADAMEMVHCHIAKTSPTPHSINTAIPKPLSQIVVKLLSKTAHARYQSARGLRADLEECRTQWQAQGDIENFPLGRYDRSGELRISTQLYGREREVSLLLKAFEQARRGGRALITVAGYSGIGKTSVVQEIHKPIARSGGFFVSGKFDQFRRDVPYVSLIQAFRELIRQVLTESEDHLAHFKEQLRDALGSNGQLLCEVIPELELIIGPQPSVPSLGPQETLNRFNFVLQQFMRVWMQPAHPLVLFLDDLQWADVASLKFLQILLSDEGSQHLLVVGAYRDNEVPSSHPLLLTLDDIRKSGLVIEEIRLEPLGDDDIGQLIQDTFRCSRPEIEPLITILAQRTKGNPFFLNQLLKAWHETKLLFCEDGEWRWDLAGIEQANLSGDVVELMATKIQGLPTVTQEALKWAACIGNRFDSRTLAMVREQSSPQVGIDLWDALREGLITPLGDGYQTLHLLDATQSNETVVHYKFLHDRVQQAAYSLLDEAQRVALHAKIGRLMLQNLSEDERENKIFEIVSHLNQARVLVTGHAERLQLARLNLQAGLKAKASAAHQAALKFFTLGQEVAPGSLWEEDYATAFQLACERSECEYLEGHFETAEAQFEIALTRANTVMDSAMIEKIRVQLYITRNDYERALNVGLEGLATLGLRLPARPKQITVLRALLSTKKYQRRQPIANIAKLPHMADERHLAQMRFITLISTAAFLSGQQNLFALSTLKNVQLSLRYGNATPSAGVYTGYGVILGLAFGNYKSGFDFGEMAIQLSEQFDALDGRGRALFVFGALLMVWRRPWRESQPILEESYRLSFEGGDLIYGGYAIFQLMSTPLLWGVELEKVDANIERYMPYLRTSQDPNQLVMAYMARQMGRSLQGLTVSRWSLSDEGFNETQTQEDISRGEHNETCECWYYLVKTRLCYLQGDYIGALKMARATERVLPGLKSNAHETEHNLSYSLTLTALYPDAAPAQRKIFRKQLAKNQGQMKKWSKNCPPNFEHKWLLVAAEIARIKGRSETAQLYDDAIAAAHEADYPQNEALANELATRFHASGGRPRLAQLYFKSARYLYAKWGAQAKVATLDEEFPALVPEAIMSGEASPIDPHRTTDGTKSEKTSALDLATVIKAAQALSGEIDWRPLLQKLLRFALENAGATRGALILRRDDQFVIEAIGSAAEDEISLPALPLEEPCEELPLSLVQYVARTRESVVLSNAFNEGLFTADNYIVAHQSKSIICAPIVHQTKLNGAIYLENELAYGAFTPAHLEVLGVLSAQAAISLQNAQLYGRLEEYSRNLQQRVEERTDQLRHKNQELEQTLRELQEMQDRVIMQEKLASLGALTAGIAHEIKNPLNFVNNFAELSVDLTSELAEEIEKLTGLDDATREYLEEILGDLKGNSQKINEHGKRADSIVRNMLLHSRGQDSPPEETDLNSLVREAVQLAYQGQRVKDNGFNVSIEENYNQDVGTLRILPQEISRVILNLTNNACYAAHEKALRLGADFSPAIRVTTKNIGANIQICVADNGDGIPNNVRAKIFTPFFTTKPTGEGTGLGLSMSYEIVVQQHQGNLTVQSTIGQGTEFVVSLPQR